MLYNDMASVAVRLLPLRHGVAGCRSYSTCRENKSQMWVRVFYLGGKSFMCKNWFANKIEHWTHFSNETQNSQKRRWNDASPCFRKKSNRKT
jgi:hypothetical protein